MKNILTTVFCTAAVFVVVALPGAIAATIDNFNDLDDTNNPTWTHLSGLALSTGQSWDASTGEYRLQAPANGFTSSGIQYGFVGSHVGPSFTDVNVMADFVQPASGFAYGVAARLNGSNAFNGLKGYTYAFEQDTSAALGVGEMVFYRVTGLNVSDIGNDGPAVRFVTLDLANKDYTFTLNITGTTLYGEVREVGGPVVAYQTKTDATYASGFSGLVGIAARTTVGPPLTLPADFTVDNFKTQVPEPATSLLVALGAGVMLLGRRFCSAR